MDANEAAAEPNGDPAEGTQPETRHAVQAEHASADRRRRAQLHQRLGHRIVRKLEEARGEQQQNRNRVAPGHGEASKRHAPEHHEDESRTGARRQQATAFEQDPRGESAAGIRGEQHAVKQAGRAGAEVVREARHLRLIGVADKHGRAAGQQDH